MKAIFHFSIIALIFLALPSAAARLDTLPRFGCWAIVDGASFSVREIEPRLFHLKFSKPREMSDSFMRIQEHYESPQFRGQVFSRKEYREWYRQVNGRFTYHSDWGGFNVPDKAFLAFFEGRFKNITNREKILLETFRDLEGPFYVIGTADDSAVKHEIAHGRFYLNPQYREKMRKAIEAVDTAEIKEWLKKVGYDESVFDDEIQAYLVDTTEVPKDFPIENFRELVQELRRIEKKFYP